MHKARKQKFQNRRPTRSSSVNSHPTCELRLVLELIRIGVFLLRIRSRTADEVGLEALAEVVHADEGVDDGQDDENDGEDGKGGQRAAHGDVILAVARLVDPDELEEKVGQAAEVEENDANDAEAVLALGEEGGAQQDSDGDGDGGDMQAELEVLDAVDDDKELHRETQEEEKVKLEHGDVDLGGN